MTVARQTKFRKWLETWKILPKMLKLYNIFSRHFGPFPIQRVSFFIHRFDGAIQMFFFDILLPDSVIWRNGHLYAHRVLQWHKAASSFKLKENCKPSVYVLSRRREICQRFLPSYHNSSYASMSLCRNVHIALGLIIITFTTILRILRSSGLVLAYYYKK